MQARAYTTIITVQSPARGPAAGVPLHECGPGPGLEAENLPYFLSEARCAGAAAQVGAPAPETALSAEGQLEALQGEWRDAQLPKSYVVGGRR